MRIYTLQALLVVCLIFIALPSQAQRARRRAQKQYTSPEQIKNEQDSIRIATMSLEHADTLSFIEEYTTHADDKTNSIQQIDSALAMWRTTSTVEAYERYFNDFVLASQRIDTTLRSDNLDSI